METGGGEAMSYCAGVVVNWLTEDPNDGLEPEGLGDICRGNWGYVMGVPDGSRGPEDMD
jgi:hypothetical protein